MNVFMKGFFLGVVTTIIVVYLLGYFDQKDLPKELNELANEKMDLTVEEKNTNKNASLLVENDSISDPLDKVTLQESKIRIKAKLHEQLDATTANIRSDRFLINRMLDELDQSNLSRLIGIIEQLDAKQPGELFELEEVDPVWSLKKQSELEFSFYEQSSLRDLGNLDSVVCKTNFCKVSISLPKSTDVGPSDYLGWANPRSVSIQNDPSNNDTKVIFLIVGKE